MLNDIRNLADLDLEKQIEILNDCIDELKDDDINKSILINKRNSIKTSNTKNNYEMKANIYKVNS